MASGEQVRGGGLAERDANHSSTFQATVIPTVVDKINKVVADQLDVSIIQATSTIVIADFGVAGGKNSLNIMRTAIKSLRDKIGDSTKPVELFFEDLPWNQWHIVFEVTKELMEEDKNLYIFASGTPFTMPVLPPSRLHLATCLTSLHWLSRIPNLGAVKLGQAPSTAAKGRAELRRSKGKEKLQQQHATRETDQEPTTTSPEDKARGEPSSPERSSDQEQLLRFRYVNNAITKYNYAINTKGEKSDALTRTMEEAFARQAADDWKKFLLHRTAELIQGGIMVVGVLGVKEETKAKTSSFMVDYLFRAQKQLLQKKAITQEEFDSFVLPAYLRTEKELLDIEALPQDLKVLSWERIEGLFPPLQHYEESKRTERDRKTFATEVVSFYRTTMENTLVTSLVDLRKGKDRDKLLAHTAEKGRERLGRIGRSIEKVEGKLETAVGKLMPGTTAATSMEAAGAPSTTDYTAEVAQLQPMEDMEVMELGRGEDKGVTKREEDFAQAENKRQEERLIKREKKLEKDARKVIDRMFTIMGNLLQSEITENERQWTELPGIGWFLLTFQKDEQQIIQFQQQASSQELARTPEAPPAPPPLPPGQTIERPITTRGLTA